MLLMSERLKAWHAMPHELSEISEQSTLLFQREIGVTLPSGTATKNRGGDYKFQSRSHLLGVALLLLAFSTAAE